MTLEYLVFLGGAAAIVLVTLAAFIVRRRGREHRSRLRRAAAIEASLHLPASLHPVIDPAICMGSLSCIRACPEGDILGVLDGAAALIEGANCIGHGRCAAECPVGAIKLVFGTSERGVDLPEVDAVFESSRPGVHIVGELGGMGLIKNAITQGLQVAETLAARLGRSRDDGAAVLIVGAGPAGLATAVGLRHAGVSFSIVDQGGFGGTMAAYPRHKVVMTESVQLPLVGRFGRSTMTKEQLIEAWQKVCAKAGVRVQEGIKVEGIAGADGDFTVATSKGPLRARKVVLAIGRRGTPRRLGVPGEDLPKVTYRLIDPEQYKAARVLVVGGGDSALEAATALCDTAQTEVTLSYRGAHFQKSRRANQERIAGLARERRLRLVLESRVERIGADHVALTVGGREQVLPNDYVIGCTGGELPADLLSRAGISMKRHFGETVVPAATLSRSKSLTEEQRSRWLVPVLWTLGIAVIALLAWVGRDYYPLPRAARLRSPLRENLRPGGPWGHGVGIVATLVMLSNFLYAGRKRLRLLRGTAPIRSWLTVHMIVGFLSPFIIAFHAAFQWNNLLATVTFVSLLLVVGAGIVGRFIYGLVPRQGGVEASVALLAARWERDRQTVVGLLGDGGREPAGKRLLAEVAAAEQRARTLVGLLVRMPFAGVRRRWLLARARRLVSAGADFGVLRKTVSEMTRVRDQMAFHSSLRRLLSGWRAFHVSLSVLLVAVIAAHIGVAVYLGYLWVLR